MFGLFGKKETGIKVKDKVWMAEAAKLQAIVTVVNNNPSAVFIFWFDETLKKVQSLFPSGINTDFLLHIREVRADQLTGHTIFFAEHYPLIEKEKDFFQKLDLQEAEIWSALDESLFKQFGGDKIIQVMKQMGMKEDASVEHTMVSKAIRNAQEKISNKVLIDQTSSSPEEWLKKNMTV